MPDRCHCHELDVLMPSTIPVVNVRFLQPCRERTVYEVGTSTLIEVEYIEVLRSKTMERTFSLQSYLSADGSSAA